MRRQITEEQWQLALDTLEKWLNEKRRLKGDNTFASVHEMRGCISEEYDELMEAMHKEHPARIMSELKDLGVTVLVGIASILCWGSSGR